MTGLFDVNLGEALALVTALTWAVAVILFKKSGESVHPIALNLFKDLLSVILFIPTIWLLGMELFRDVPYSDYMMMLASGVIGIGLGDTLFFKSLNTLGAGLASIVDCMYSPSIIVLSMMFLHESLTVWQLIGATMIVSAVLSAGLERSPGDIDRKRLLKGIGYGVAAQVMNGIGVVMIKPLLDRSPVIWVTQWRLIGGSAVLLIVLWFWKRRQAVIDSLLYTRSWGYVIAGSVIGAYLAMMLWLGGMKYTQASTASALNQTSNIFVFILAAVFLREKVTPARAAGIIVAVMGAVMVTLL